MIIKAITLENFKSHVNTHIDLDTGISIIMGDNGAGKSSILESVSFALFKEYASKKMDKLISNDKNKMQVTVEFIANGRTYKVIRKRKRSSSPESMLYVKDNDRFVVIEKGDAAVSEQIEKIIDLDKNLFLNAVYVRQGEIANLVTQNPAEKKEMMGRLLGVQELENSWKNMKFVIDDYKNQEIRINGKLENLGNIEEEKKKKEIKRNELTSILTEIEFDLAKREEKLGKLKTVKEFFDQKEIEFNKLKQAIEHGNLTLNRLNINEKDLSNQINEISNKETEIGTIKPEISKISVLENIKDKICKLKDLEKEKVHVDKSLKKIQLFKSIMDQNKEFHDNFVSLEREIDELNKSRKQFEGSDTLKNTLKGNVKTLSNKIEELEKSISNKLKLYGELLEEDITSINELELYLQTKKSDLEANLKQNLEQINEFNSKISDLKGQNKEINKAISELTTAEDICPVCESDLDENRREELLDKYKLQIENNEREISSHNENLKIFSSEREFLEKQKAEISNINIDVLKKDSESLQKNKNEINEISIQLAEIEKFVESLKDIDIQLNEKIKLKNELKAAHQKYLGASNSLKAMENPEELLELYNKIEKDIEPLKFEINQLCLEVNIEKESVKEELEKLRKMKEKYDKLCGEVSIKEDVLKSLSKVKTEIVTLSNDIEAQKEKITQINYEVEKHNQAKEDLNKGQKELEDIQKEIGSLKGQLKSTNERLDELGKEIQIYNSDKKELEKIGRFIELLNEIRKLYGKDGIQKDLRSKSRPLIEKNTLEFFNKFNFEYSDIKLNEDYDVTLFGPSGENTLDMISGGEIIAVAIALRLGIAKTLVKGNLEMMILDEPTIHLDSYRRHELIDVIKKLSVIPQMIIVTHDSGLEEAAHNILKIEKKNGISEIATL
ncbi:AAA family ATPase [Methanobacterium sp. ACI-7]|uniref:AAA family ATPase n=1 Tax=unclassified Methanobacterium TaxID=2627676 RepID=UPI0039C1AFB7